jgi:stearoyl-CoA desaturase (delta-9 desaturase)
MDAWYWYVLFGIWDISGWGKVGVTLVFTFVTILAVTIYLHRHQAHRALELHPLLAHFFRAWLWLTTGMQTKEWVAIHRKHHKTVETVEDPHSPHVFGIKRLLLEGSEIYTQARQDEAMIEKWGRGTPDDFLERHVYSQRWLGIVIMCVIDLVFFGFAGGGPSVFGIQMLWIPFFAAGVINGLGHYFGYRNYEIPDASRNIVPWGILIGGEELHNNHHQAPGSARLSARWWEVDIGWCFICIFSWVRLAKVNTAKLAPKHHKSDPKYLLHLYQKKVFAPLLGEFSSKHERRIIRKLVVRQSWCISSREKLMHALSGEHAASLHSAWQLREKLAEALRARGNAISVWCNAAQHSSILAIRNFAKHIQAQTNTASADSGIAA